MYCTLEDLNNRFGERHILAVAKNSDGELDTDRVNQAINDASDEIDLYVGKVTSLPLQGDAPPVLKRLSADIARYLLQSNKPMDEVTKRYENAIKTLKDIAAGRADLGIDPPSSDVPGMSVYVEKGEEDRIFTKDTLSGF